MEDLLLLLADREAALERYRARLRALNEQVPSICSDFFCLCPLSFLPILFSICSRLSDRMCKFSRQTRIFSFEKYAELLSHQNKLTQSRGFRFHLFSLYNIFSPYNIPP